MTDAKMNREEILVLARFAGLDLPDVYLDELVDAFAHVQTMVARLPRDVPRGDEPAHVFVPARFAPREG